MKKLLFLLLVLPFVFTSCSSDDDEKDNRLTGTKWETNDRTYQAFYGGRCYRVFEFISDSEVEEYTTQNGKVVKSHGKYNYHLDYPKLTIYYTYNFTDSRTFLREGKTKYDEYAEFIKQ